MNVPVLFLAKGTKVHPKFIVKKLVTRYGLPEGSCVIAKKTAYMNDETWAKVVKVVAPSIRKMEVSNIACVLPTLFSIYLTLLICISKSSAYDM